jgi:heme oxygenase
MSALALRLHQATLEAHRAAEGITFVRSVVRGTVARSDYALFLAQLRSVYAALEAALVAHQEDPRVGPVVWPKAFRVAAIDEDLAYYGLTAPLPVLPATLVYVRHLEALSQRAPHRLVAHAYTRTLGDLSGGQSLKKALHKAWELPADAGTRFFDFPELGDLTAAKDTFRAQLDALPLSAGEADEVVAEAILAFRHNGAVAQAITDLALASAGTSAHP